MEYFIGDFALKVIDACYPIVDAITCDPGPTFAIYFVFPPYISIKLFLEPNVI